jgi:HlyD family secretion protein
MRRTAPVALRADVRRGISEIGTGFGAGGAGTGVKRGHLLALAGLALLLAGGWPAVRAMLGTAVVVERVGRADLVRSVVASGHVETPFRVEIGAQITGTVAEVLAAEGERVARGQKLVAIESRELEAALVQADGAVAQAEARLRQLVEFTLPAARETLAQAEATLRSAQAGYARTSELAQNGHASRAALDESRRGLDIAQSQVAAARLLIFTSAPGGSDFVLAQTQRDQAIANRETARARLAHAGVLAPRDGIVIARDVERGTVVQPGRKLLVLAPAGDTLLVLQIDERNLGLLAPGQPALASADAFPDRLFAARVQHIGPAIDIARASVEVRLLVPDPPDHLRQDMTVSVDIEVARRSGTLVLPAGSVRELRGPLPWVMGLRDGRAARVPVRLGLRGDSAVEILDGIAEGAVAIPVAAGVAIGQRVRPVDR